MVKTLLRRIFQYCPGIIQCFFLGSGLANRNIVRLWQLLFIFFAPFYLLFGIFCRIARVKFIYFPIPSSVGHVFSEFEYTQLITVLLDKPPSNICCVLSGASASKVAGSFLRISQSSMTVFTNNFIYALIFPVFFVFKDLIQLNTVAHLKLNSASLYSRRACLLLAHPFLSKSNFETRLFNMKYYAFCDANRRLLTEHRDLIRSNILADCNEKIQHSYSFASDCIVVHFKSSPGNATLSTYEDSEKQQIISSIGAKIGGDLVQIGINSERVLSNRDNAITSLLIGDTINNISVGLQDQISLCAHSSIGFINSSGVETILSSLNVPYVYFNSWHLAFDAPSWNAINVPALVYDKVQCRYLNFPEQLALHDYISNEHGHNPTFLYGRYEGLKPTSEEILEAAMLLRHGSDFLRELALEQLSHLRNYLVNSPYFENISLAKPILPSKLKVLLKAV